MRNISWGKEKIHWNISDSSESVYWIDLVANVLFTNV